MCIRDSDITLEESQKLIDSYYEQATEAQKITEEADKVSIKITKLLSNKAFTFSVAEYINIHKFLFKDVYDRDVYKRQSLYKWTARLAVLNCFAAYSNTFKVKPFAKK